MSRKTECRGPRVRTHAVTCLSCTKDPQFIQRRSRVEVVTKNDETYVGKMDILLTNPETGVITFEIEDEQSEAVKVLTSLDCKDCKVLLD